MLYNVSVQIKGCSATPVMLINLHLWGDFPELIQPTLKRKVIFLEM